MGGGPRGLGAAVDIPGAAPALPRRPKPAARRPWYQGIAPTSPSYATSPVADAFTWGRCAAWAEPGEWYLVAFRSIRRETADEGRLERYDRRAHREAKRMPGFLHYFKGRPTARGECLSFCLWESREHARAAAREPGHLEAIGVVHEMYEVYRLEFLRVIKRPGADRFEFEPFDRADVG